MMDLLPNPSTGYMLKQTISAIYQKLTKNIHEVLIWTPVVETWSYMALPPFFLSNDKID